MPEGVIRNPSFTRALILPDVPWLIPRRFMSWQAAMISRRRGSYFNAVLPDVFLGRPDRLVAARVIAHQELQWHGGEHARQRRRWAPVGHQIGRLLEVLDPHRRIFVELGVI